MYMSQIAIEKPPIFKDERTQSEMLDFIIGQCLWHEPHQLQEIVANFDLGNDGETFSKRALKRNLCAVLRDARDNGYLQSERGFFRLTAFGRTAWKNWLKL
jgi:hypothetical protein